MAGTSSPRTPEQHRYQQEDDNTTGGSPRSRATLGASLSSSISTAPSMPGTGSRRGLKKGKERLQRLMNRVATVRPGTLDDVLGASLSLSLGRAPSLAPPSISNQRSTKGPPGGQASTAEQLAAFESGSFRLEARLAGLNEKGVARLRSELAHLDSEASDGIRRAVHHYYTHYIKASQGIGELEGEMQTLRNQLAEAGTLVTTLKEAMAESVEGNSSFPAAPNPTAAAASWALTPEGTRWVDALEEVDVAIALRNPNEAWETLRALTKLTHPPRDRSPRRGAAAVFPSPSSQEGPNEQQTAELEERRASVIKLLETLVGDVGRAGVSAAGTHAAVAALAAVAGRAHAGRRLLEAHAAALRARQHQLLKPQSTGGAESDGADYAGALAQVVFRGIASATSDMSAIFGKDAQELACLLVVWALRETELCALLIKRHALAPFAAPAGLGPTVACVLLPLLHCRALEQLHSLSLGPRLLRDLWPPCEQVLQRRLKRVAEEVTLQVMEEVDTMAYAGVPVVNEPGWEGVTSLFPSAAELVRELQGIVEILTPLSGPRAGAALRRAFTELFRVYVDALCRAFEEHQTSDGPFVEMLDPAVEPAMEAAVTMAEQWLPQLAAPLEARCGPVCEMAILHAQLEELAATLGLQLHRVEVSASDSGSYGV